MIYQLYIDGNGDEQICKLLNSMDIAPNTGTKWHWSTIKSILNNYNYTGDLILQKTYRENHLTKKKKTNNGEFDKYLIRGDHEPIISKDLYFQAKKTRQKRLNKIKSAPLKKDYAFSGMIKCGVCGRGYTHKSTAYKEIWKCSYSNKRGIDACDSKQVPDDKVIEAANHIFDRPQFNQDFFKSKVESIVVMPEKRLIFHMKDGTSIEYNWTESSRSESWTPGMKEQARIKELNRLKGGV